MKLGAHALAERAAYDQFQVTERCAFCPEWMFTGTVQEGREAARQHRSKFHPGKERRRRRLKRGVLTTADQIKTSEAARIKRAFLLGIEIDP